MADLPTALLLTLADDQLFASLGATLLDDEFGLGPTDPLKVGREWWDMHSKRLSEAIRTSPNFTAFLANPERWDDAELVAAIFDFISPIVGVPPAATISVLLLRRIFHKRVSLQE